MIFLNHRSRNTSKNNNLRKWWYWNLLYFGGFYIFSMHIIICYAYNHLNLSLEDFYWYLNPYIYSFFSNFAPKFTKMGLFDQNVALLAQANENGLPSIWAILSVKIARDWFSGYFWQKTQHIFWLNLKTWKNRTHSFLALFDQIKIMR